MVSMAFSRQCGILLGLAFLLGEMNVKVEDSYELWPRYAPLTQKSSAANMSSVVVPGSSETEHSATPRGSRRFIQPTGSFALTSLDSAS